MNRSYKGRGIVLNTVKYGDSSMVVQMLTDVAGRQSFIVRGVRSSNGRGSKMALFQPLFALEFEGYKPTRSEMHTFREVRSAIILGRTPFDVRRSTIALFIAEVLYRLVRESESNPSLFDFVWRSVEALDIIDEGVANFHLWFLVNLSRFLGFLPGNSYTQGCWFDIEQGVYTPIKPKHQLVMNPVCTEQMRDFMECDVRHLAEIGLNRTQRVELLEALLCYYDYHLDAVSSINSVHILREVF